MEAFSLAIYQSDIPNYDIYLSMLFFSRAFGKPTRGFWKIFKGLVNAFQEPSKVLLEGQMKALKALKGLIRTLSHYTSMLKGVPIQDSTRNRVCISFPIAAATRFFVAANRVDLLLAVI